MNSHSLDDKIQIVDNIFKDVFRKDAECHWDLFRQRQAVEDVGIELIKNEANALSRRIGMGFSRIRLSD